MPDDLNKPRIILANNSVPLLPMRRCIYNPDLTSCGSLNPNLLSLSGDIRLLIDKPRALSSQTGKCVLPLNVAKSHMTHVSFVFWFLMTTDLFRLTMSVSAGQRAAVLTVIWDVPVPREASKLGHMIPA